MTLEQCYALGQRDTRWLLFMLTIITIIHFIDRRQFWKRIKNGHDKPPVYNPDEYDR